METFLLVIAIVAIIIESLVLANTKRKLKAETKEANRLRTEMLRAQNNVIFKDMEIEDLKAEIKRLEETIKDLQVQ